MPCSTPVISKLNQRLRPPFLQWPVTPPFEMLPMRVALSVLLLASALSACTPAPVSTANSAEAPAPAKGIAWRQGDVDDAFAEAADSGKPVLLYWGAVWCPPCNQLKAGLFKDPAFIALTSKFVPVYLDGDEEGAQAWGERFGVRGYPTLIVLDPQRNEITRVAGGNDAAELTRALTVAAGRRSAVAATLATALATPGSLATEDWQVLGDYGWEVDANRLAGERNSQEVLRQLSKAAPGAALQRRFALLALATAEKPDASPTEVRELLQAVLAQPAEVRRNRELLGYAGAKLVKQASAGPATSNTLGQQLLVALERADAERGDRADDALSRALTEVSLARQQQPKGVLPAALVERVKQRVAAADAAATDAHARQATISSAVYALREVGDDTGAEALLLAELKRSEQPYYYMPELAELAEQRGDTAGALAWLKRAYDGAQGPATRVQWGVLYVEGLLKLAPDDAPRIEQATASLIAELEAQPSGYHQRTRQRFERLAGQLKAWSSKHRGAETLARLQQRMQQACGEQVDGACKDWLS